MVQMNRFAGQKLRHRFREQTYGHQGGKVAGGGERRTGGVWRRVESGRARKRNRIHVSLFLSSQHIVVMFCVCVCVSVCSCVSVLCGWCVWVRGMCV